MVLELIKGVALLLALAFLHKFIVRYFRDDKFMAQISFGALFGAVCIVGMSSPITLAPGVIFDARSVILSIAGLFGGVISASISVVIAGGYRLWLGGGGAEVGVAVVIMSASLGLIYRHLHSNEKVKITPLNLFIFGLLVHIVEVGLFTQLPAEIVPNVLNNIAIPLILTLSPAVPILGLLIMDNEERIALEAALKHQRLTIDQHALFSTTDKNGNILAANEKFCEVSGYSENELVGQNHRIFNSGHHSDDFFENMWKTLSSGHVWSGEIKNKRKNGTFFWVKSTIVPYAGDSGEPEIYQSIRTDITEEKEREEKLAIARNNAQEANAARATFIASMSHELRTPLNAIIGFSDMINKQILGSIGNPKYVEYAEDIYASGQSLLSMVDEILDISKLESSHIQFELEEYDIVAYSKALNRRFESALFKNNITLEHHSTKRVPSLMLADKKRQTHIHNNLVSNAIKHVDVGGVILINWDVSDADELVLTVSDNGSGMSAGILAKIGQPFMIGDNAYLAKDKDVGNGLGLYITKNIIEQRGGKFEVRSKLGIGTTVRASWPLTVLKK